MTHLDTMFETWRTLGEKPCTCGHRLEHHARGGCLVSYCRCESFTLAEGDPVSIQEEIDRA